MNNEKEKDRILLGGLRQFCGVKCFPESIDKAVFLGRGLGGISGIILVNCESSVSSIGSYRDALHQETQRTTRPETLADTSAPTGC